MWQPIETAPKDGTEILLYRDDAGILLGRWDAVVSFMTEREIDESGIDDDTLHEQDWFCADFISGFRLADDPPTHWAPLPNPPTDQQATE